MIKTFSLDLNLLKFWFKLSLESSNCRKLLFNFYKARSIESRISAKISKCKKAITYPFEAQIAIPFFPIFKGHHKLTLGRVFRVI